MTTLNIFYIKTVLEGSYTTVSHFLTANKNVPQLRTKMILHFIPLLDWHPDNSNMLKRGCHNKGCNLWRNGVKLLSFSEQLVQPYLEEMCRTGTGLLEVRDFLRVKLDYLWLPEQKYSTSVRQRSGRCWHPARAATGCEQNGGNLNQLRHKLQPCS